MYLLSFHHFSNSVDPLVIS